MIGIVCFVTVLGVALVWLSAYSGHRRPPTPEAMVFRVEAREVCHPKDRFDVFAVERGEPAIAVFSAAALRHSTEGTEEVQARPSLRVFSYPDGRMREEWSGDDALRFRDEHQPRFVEFDFDGDGQLDGIEGGSGSDYGIARVRSGADRSVLYEDDDPLEYECGDRTIPLGDVDHDGYSELALLHPRMDRSYDLEWDLPLGAKSWITIVSGSRIRR